MENYRVYRHTETGDLAIAAYHTVDHEGYSTSHDGLWLLRDWACEEPATWYDEEIPVAEFEPTQFEAQVGEGWLSDLLSIANEEDAALIRERISE